MTVRKKPNLHSYQRDVTGGIRTADCVCKHMSLRVSLTAETKGPINEGLFMKMPKDATLVNAARPESVHLSLSARDQTSVTSPMRHPRAPRKSRHSPVTSPRSASSSPRGKETQADNRSISMCVYRTALRHPVVSTSNAESFEVREDASESSCPQA